MKWITAMTVATVAAGLAAPVAAGDWTQLIASAGLSPSEAQGMTLTEIAAHKINRESPGDDRVTVSTRSYPVFDVAGHSQLVAVAGVSPSAARGMTLTEISARKVNLGTRGDDRIPLVDPATRGFDPAAHPQLVAAAGLEPAEATGMSLNEVYVRKFNREQRGDDRQRIVE
jgi:hypothetical protein